MTLEELRTERNSRIAKTDYLVLPDVGLSDGDLEIIKTYRQELRDLPDAYADMTEDTVVDWPIIPVQLGGVQPLNEGDGPAAEVTPS